MSLVLTISDNGDGSGGVASISGSTLGSTNTLYYVTYLGIQLSYPWISYGTRTGDGNINVSLPVSNYFFYVSNNNSGNLSTSNIVFQGFTNSSINSIHYNCLLTYQSVIQGLSLSGISSSNINVSWIPRNWDNIDTVNFPQILITPLGKEGQPGILNNEDDIQYPIVVAIIDLLNQNYSLNLARNLLWRQQIFRAFRHQPLLGVNQIITTDVQPDYILNPELYNKNLFYSAMLFLPRSREPRGQ